MRDSARALLAEVAESRIQFEAAWLGRAELLGRRYAIFRFCQHYRSVSARFERRFHRPMNTTGKVKPITHTKADFDWRATTHRGGQQFSDWRADGEFFLDERGRPYPTVANIVQALDLAPELGNLVKYDAEAKKYWLMGTIPGDTWAENVAPILEPRFLNADDVTMIRAYLESPAVGFVGISQDDVLSAVRAVGKRYAFGGEV